MKRSRSIKLVLIGGVSAGALTGCDSNDVSRAPLSASAVYTNNFYVQGAGYYHAPYRAWYHIPYNQFEPKSGLYFHGGQWSAQPHQSITNISSPTPESAALAQAARTDSQPTPSTVQRRGFGGTSRSHWISS